MDIIITPGPLSGSISAPPSKSCAHRILICAAIANKPSCITWGPMGRDVQATIDCLRALGARIEEVNGHLYISPIQIPNDNVLLPCAESGSTLRFLLPLVGALGVEATFVLEGRLAQRPLSPLWEEMQRMGCQLSRPTENTILCKGQLRSGTYKLSGAVSSQFISGLLMAIPLLGSSQIEITGKLVSQPYVDLTLDILHRRPTAVEGDWSNAAFFLAANALGNHIYVDGLREHSCQGDRAVLRLLRKLEDNIVISANDVPDLIPILSVVASCKKGAAFTDISRLRQKESDRIEAIVSLLQALGGKAEASKNKLIVYPASLIGGTVDSKNDHRIAMAAAIAAGVCKENVTILGAECVNKSYSSFWEDYKQLGGMLCPVSTEKA